MTIKTVNAIFPLSKNENAERNKPMSKTIKLNISTEGNGYGRNRNFTPITQVIVHESLWSENGVLIDSISQITGKRLETGLFIPVETMDKIAAEWIAARKAKKEETK